MKWVAAQQAPQAETQAAECAVTLDGFDHVFGTGGVKAASGRNHGGDPSLISTKDEDQLIAQNGLRRDPAGGLGGVRRSLCASQLHRSITLRKARTSSGKGAFSAARRGLSTMSHFAARPARWRRKASRSLRLIRLRTTAPPTARGTVSPNRGPPSGTGSGRARQKAANSGLETRKPWS
jgi:hypothetical protein